LSYNLSLRFRPLFLLLKMIKYLKPIAAIIAGMCILLCISCAANNGESFVHQKVPIEIQGNEILTVEMHRLVGSHPVGIRCSPEVWNELKNCQKSIVVRLKSADKQPAETFGFEPGLTGTTCDQVAHCHYFFMVSAIGNIVVEISFPKMPLEAPAEMIICMTPEETERPF
jgi:hypothetical protein